MKLYRPVGQKEYELIEKSGFKKFPPRLEWQPIFYPVLNREYAQQIARDWNTKDEFSGYIGYVLEFEVKDEFLANYDIQTVGGSIHKEYWIPAEDLKLFNKNIVKRRQDFSIRVIDKFVGDNLVKEELKNTFFLSKIQLHGTCYHEFKPGKWDKKHWSDESIYLSDDDILPFVYIFIKTIPKYDQFCMYEIDKKEIIQLKTIFKSFDESLTKKRTLLDAYKDINVYDRIAEANKHVKEHQNEFVDGYNYLGEFFKIDVEKLINTIAYFIEWLDEVLNKHGCFALLGI